MNEDPRQDDQRGVPAFLTLWQQRDEAEEEAGSGVSSFVYFIQQQTKDRVLPLPSVPLGSPCPSLTPLKRILWVKEKEEGAGGGKDREAAPWPLLAASLGEQAFVFSLTS